MNKSMAQQENHKKQTMTKSLNTIEDAKEAEEVIKNHFMNMDANKDNKISWDEWKEYHMTHKTPMSKSQDLMK